MRKVLPEPETVAVPLLPVFAPRTVLLESTTAPPVTVNEPVPSMPTPRPPLPTVQPEPPPSTVASPTAPATMPRRAETLSTLPPVVTFSVPLPAGLAGSEASPPISNAPVVHLVPPPAIETILAEWRPITTVPLATAAPAPIDMVAAPISPTTSAPSVSSREPAPFMFSALASADSRLPITVLPRIVTVPPAAIVKIP